MRTEALIAVLLAGTVLLGGCKEKNRAGDSGPDPGAPPPNRLAGPASDPAASADSPESLVEELMAEMRAYHAAIHRVTNVKSAQVAEGEMQEVTARIETLADRLAKLEVPAAEVRVELGRRLRDSERQVNEEMGDVEDKIAALDAEARAIMEKAIGEVGAKMHELLVVFGEYYEVRGGDE